MKTSVWISTFLPLILIGPLSANSPADFILSNVDSRNQSLGGAYAADLKAEGTFSRLPSVLAVSSGSAVGFGLGLRPEGVKIFRAHYTRRLGRFNAGINLLNFSYPSQSVTDNNGNVTGETTNSDLAVTAAGARSIGVLKLGLAGTAVRKKVADATASGLSLSGSLIYPIRDNLNFGVSAADLTLYGLKFDQENESFPTQFRTGFTGRILSRDSFSLDVLGDLLTSAERSIDFDFGTELILNEYFFLRGGIDTQSKAGRLGIGILLNKMNLDWSMQIGALGSKEMMNFTLGYHFK